MVALPNTVALSTRTDDGTSGRRTIGERCLRFRRINAGSNPISAAAVAVRTGAIAGPACRGYAVVHAGRLSLSSGFFELVSGGKKTRKKMCNWFSAPRIILLSLHRRVYYMFYRRYATTGGSGSGIARAATLNRYRGGGGGGALRRETIPAASHETQWSAATRTGRPFNRRTWNTYCPTPGAWRWSPSSIQVSLARPAQPLSPVFVSGWRGGVFFFSSEKQGFFANVGISVSIRCRTSPPRESSSVRLVIGHSPSLRFSIGPLHNIY